MEKTYQNYMSQLQQILAQAGPAVGIVCGPSLIAVLVDGNAAWFDNGDGIAHLGDFDESAWNGQAWDGETPDETWAALEGPQFVQL